MARRRISGRVADAGAAVFKLDPDSLRYVALKPGGALAGLPRDELVNVLLRRSDAWTFRGRKAAWVEGLIASLDASSSAGDLVS